MAIESAGPIEGLAREAWLALPASRRRRASVATWAFGNGNRFDLVAAAPAGGRRAGPSYVDPASIEAGPAARASGRRAASPRPGRVAGGRGPGGRWSRSGWPGGRMGGSGIPGSRAGPPVPAAPEPPVGPEERARIVAGLEALADRFEAFEIGRWGDPSEFIARFSDRVHYRGPTLSAAELAGLAAEPDPDRDRALAWHERLKAFADDRPLPGDFDRLPLRRQLAEFARSFRLDPPARADASPAPWPRPCRATARSGRPRWPSRYPALSDYARFLGRLPRGETPRR